MIFLNPSSHDKGGQYWTLYNSPRFGHLKLVMQTRAEARVVVPAAVVVVVVVVIAGGDDGGTGRPVVVCLTCCDDAGVIQWSGMKRPLPDNVHLLTLEQWEAGTVLLRLEHFYAKDEDPVLSQPAKVQLKVCPVLLFIMTFSLL